MIKDYNKLKKKYNTIIQIWIITLSIILGIIFGYYLFNENNSNNNGINIEKLKMKNSNDLSFDNNVKDDDSKIKNKLNNKKKKNK